MKISMGKLEATIKKHKMLVIGGLLAVGGYYAYKNFFAGRNVSGAGQMPERDGTHAFVPSRAFYGYGGPKNPGWAALDNRVNWVAAGNAAGLDPSPYSYLTQRNENPLLSRLPFPELAGAPGKNFEAMKFQGSFGLTGPPGQGFFTYW